jgi:uncharacterized membrane protein
MKNSLKHLLMVFIALIPFGWLMYAWPQIPEIVPTHFGTNGPDAWGSKSSLYGLAAVLSGTSIGVYFLLQFIHKIDPKRANKDSAAAFNKLAVGMILFLMILNMLCLQMSAFNRHWEAGLFALIGLLFAFLGNVMHSLKPNYLAGIRLPWTLNSDDNWRQTHRLAGKLWFVGGLFLAVVPFLLPMASMAIIMPLVLGFLVLIPVIFSFRLYKKESRSV